MIKEMPSSRIRDAWYLDAHTHTKTSFIKLAGTVVDDHNLNLFKKIHFTKKTETLLVFFSEVHLDSLDIGSRFHGIVKK